MRRHGWTFCLGLLLSGTAAAQPPADLERYPPAPNLPGEVVGQLSGRPIATSAQVPAKPEAPKPAPPAPLPKVEAPPAYPARPTVTVEPAKDETKPDASAGPVAVGPVVTTTTIPTSCDSGGCSCLLKIREWLCFKSRSRQSGCYPSPYTPPLFTWFDCCEPRVCSSCAAPRCGHGCGLKGGPAPVVAPGPVILPPPGAAPMPPEAPLPPPVAADVPAPHLPGTVIATGPDVLPGFRKVDVGLSFAPGVAPMAHPTTQVEKVSNWRPK